MERLELTLRTYASYMSLGRRSERERHAVLDTAMNGSKIVYKDAFFNDVSRCNSNMR